MTRALCLSLLLVVVVVSGAQASPWRWPVDGDPVRRFAVGPDRFAAGQHRGVDLAAPVGAPVRSACTGVVRFAGAVGDAGRTVSVTCGGLVASYLHLGSVAVRRGERVAAGDGLGTVGRSGRPRGAPHLHLGARRAAGGGYVDPLTLLGRTPADPSPPLGVAPRPGLEPRPRPVAVPRPRVRPAPRAAPAAAEDPVPWVPFLGVVLVVLGAVPAVGARRRRRRNQHVHGLAHARR